MDSLHWLLFSRPAHITRMHTRCHIGTYTLHPVIRTYSRGRLQICFAQCSVRAAYASSLLVEINSGCRRKAYASAGQVSPLAHCTTAAHHQCHMPRWFPVDRTAITATCSSTLAGRCWLRWSDPVIQSLPGAEDVQPGLLGLRAWSNCQVSDQNAVCFKLSTSPVATWSVNTPLPNMIIQLPRACTPSICRAVLLIETLQASSVKVRR